MGDLKTIMNSGDLELAGIFEGNCLGIFNSAFFFGMDMVSRFGIDIWEDLKQEET